LQGCRADCRAEGQLPDRPDPARTAFPRRCRACGTHGLPEKREPARTVFHGLSRLEKNKGSRKLNGQAKTRKHVDKQLVSIKSLRCSSSRPFSRACAHAAEGMTYKDFDDTDLNTLPPHEVTSRLRYTLHKAVSKGIFETRRVSSPSDDRGCP